MTLQKVNTVDKTTGTMAALIIGGQEEGKKVIKPNTHYLMCTSI